MDKQNIAQAPLKKNETTEELVRKFLKAYRSIEIEMDDLRERKKELMEEYKDKLDKKALTQAIRVAKIKSKVDAKDTFDQYCDILDKEIL